MDPINPKTGMTHAQMREFVRAHFEEFVNRKNVRIGEVNFAADFTDHGADMRVTIEDMIAEDDKVVVRNRWTATDAASGRTLQFRGIVIWRLAGGKLAERWAHLEPPKYR